MVSLSTQLLSTTTRTLQALRQQAYAEMHHIAGSWLPSGLPEQQISRPHKTIRIDCAPPREHRLILANRRIGSLPY